MDENGLFDLLNSFDETHFADLRRRLGIVPEEAAEKATAAAKAVKLILYIKQRDQNDLSALTKAALATAEPLPDADAEANTNTNTNARGADDRPRLLVLAANPTKTSRADLDATAEAIRAALGGDEADRPYRLVVAAGVRTGELTGHLLADRPRIVHFCAQGDPDATFATPDGDGKPQAVVPASLAAWFAAVPESDRPDCVVLNACRTPETVKTLLGVVKCVIGTSRDLDDDSAAVFASAFYRALARSVGQVRAAFEAACADLDLLGMPESALPTCSTQPLVEVPTPKGGERRVDLKRVAAPTGMGDRGVGEAGSRLATVWYGTNRKPVMTRSGTLTFGNHRDDQLHLGRCEVYIPKSHQYGSIGSSWWTRLWQGDDRVRLESVNGLDEPAFWAGLAESLKKVPAGSKSAVVFLHGYWTTFDGAAARAAQIGCDLNVPGLMAFYSWPSMGNAAGYVADIDAVEASVPHLITFLRGIAGTEGVERVHLIAHSMGNRGLLAALRDLFGAEPAPGRMFDQLILAAADVDAEIFKTRSRVYPRASRRTTLYTSNHDLALRSSGLIRDNNSRAGFAPPLTVVDGIDTVLVSDVDLSLLGHGYFGSAGPVLNDMHDLIVNDLPPEKRARLVHVDSPPHWTFAR